MGFFIVATIAGHHAANAQTSYFVFTNNTGVPDDQVYVNFTAATTYSGVIGGGNQSISVGDSYSLAQLKGALPGGPSSTSDIPLFSAENYTGGGQIFITLGTSYTGTSNPPSNIVSGLVEEAIVNNTNLTNGHPNTSSNNLDTSYVNSLGIPITYEALARNNPTLSGTTYANGDVLFLGGVNPVQTPVPPATNTDIFNSLKNDPLVPRGSIVTNTYLTTSTTPGASVGTISGTTSFNSPSGSYGSDYRDWSTPETLYSSTSGTYVTYAPLIPTLTGTGAGIVTPTAPIPIQVGSYTVPAGGRSTILPGAVFGFTTVGYAANNAYSPFNPTGTANSALTADPNNLFLQGQTYSLSGTFVTDLNPSGPNYDPNISSLTGQAGLVMSGSGGATGDFKVYVTTAQLNQPGGLYGANPQYTITWTPTTGSSTYKNIEQVVTQNGSNNLVDRVVGDAASVINMGGAANNTDVWTHAQMTATGTVNLVGTVFDPNSSNFIGNPTTHQLLIGDLTSGQFFYLLSLAQTPAELAEWFGAGIQSNPLFYNNYGSDFIGDTNAYTYAYSDRLGNPLLSPGLFYTPLQVTNPDGGPALSAPDLNQVYINIILGQGDYTYTTVPETSVAWLMPLLLAGFGLMRLRSRRAVGA